MAHLSRRAAVWMEVSGAEPDASNMTYYGGSGPALQALLEGFLSCRKPGTLVHRPKRHYPETSVLGKKDSHFYVCASLNFLTDLFQSYLPTKGILPYR